MSERSETPRPENAAGWNGMRWDKAGDSASHIAGPGPAMANNSALARFLGGSPVAVFMRLLVLSLVVGALLVWLDIQPYEIYRAFERFFQRIWLMGFDAVREIAHYVLAGALIVVPIWLVLRLMNMRGR